MRIGILGSDHVVPEFIEGCDLNENIEVVSICNPYNQNEAKEVQIKYHIPEYFDSYEDMLISKNIDTVYIDINHDKHYKEAKKALNAGKNVVVEKILCISLLEAEDLYTTAEKNNVYLFEVVTMHFSPNYQKVKELLSTFKSISIVRLEYTQYSRRYKNFLKGDIHPVFDLKKAGGALRDLNIYNIHFVVGLFGEPISVSYYPKMLNRIDISGTLIMEYKDFFAVLSAAKNCLNHAEVRIQDDEKTILSNDTATLFRKFVYIDGDKKMEYCLPENLHRIHYELNELVRIVNSKDIDKYNALKNQTLSVYRVLSKVLWTIEG